MLAVQLDAMILTNRKAIQNVFNTSTMEERINYGSDFQVWDGHNFFFFKSLPNQNKVPDKRKRNKASTLVALRLTEKQKGQREKRGT